MSGKLRIFRMALMLLFAILAGNISAQTIKGTVTEENGEPIIGATVVETGTQNGTVTDLDGNFTLNVKGNEITVSYVGMTEQRVNIAGKSTVTIVMKIGRAHV